MLKGPLASAARPSYGRVVTRVLTLSTVMDLGLATRHAQHRGSGCGSCSPNWAAMSRMLR